MSINKILVQIKIIENENDQQEIQSEQVELDSNTTIEKLFEQLQSKYKFKATKSEWSCFSETTESYYDDITKSIGYSSEIIRLRINIPKYESKNESGLQLNLLITEIPLSENVSTIINTKIVIIKENKEVKIFSMDYDSSYKVKEIFNLVLNNLQEFENLPHFNHWKCQSQEYKVFSLEDQPKQEVLIIDISDCKFVLHLQIMDNALEECQKKIQIDDSAQIVEIYHLIHEELGIQSVIEDWTCYSKRQKTHIHNLQENIGKQYDNDTFIINIAQNAKQQLLKRQNITPIQNPGYCLIHPGNLIQFICLEKQCNLRKLCNLCQYNQHDPQHNKQILCDFAKKIEDLAEILLAQKDLYNPVKQKLSNFQEKIFKLLEKYYQFFETLFKFEHDTINIANKIKTMLNSNNEWLDSSSFIEEMVYMLNSNYIEKQNIINQTNLQTAQQNQTKFESYFNEFQQKVYYLDFHIVPEFQWYQYINISELNLLQQQVKFEGKPLNKLSIEDNEYGKYLIQFSDIKLEILDVTDKLIDVTYDINFGLKLQDLGDFVQKKILKIQNDYRSWTFKSVGKNMKLTNFNEQICHLIKKDVIQIHVMNLPDETKKLKMIDLKVNIKYGFQSRIMRQTFSQNCTLYEIEDAVLNYCEIVRDETTEIYFELYNQKYMNEEKRQKTLKQLQIISELSNSPQLPITAHIKKKDSFIYPSPPIYLSQNCHERMITLQCIIIDGQIEKNLLLQQYQYNCLSDLVQLIEFCCKINKNTQTIDIFIADQEFNQQYKRRKTFQELGIVDNQKIQVKIRWTGG